MLIPRRSQSKSLLPLQISQSNIFSIIQRPFKCEVPGCEKTYCHSSSLKHHVKVNHSSTAMYRKFYKYVLHGLWIVRLYMVNVQCLLVFFMLPILPQPIKVSCDDILSSAWFVNVLLLQCMLCINELRHNCWFDCTQKWFPDFWTWHLVFTKSLCTAVLLAGSLFWFICILFIYLVIYVAVYFFCIFVIPFNIYFVTNLYYCSLSSNSVIWPMYMMCKYHVWKNTHKNIKFYFIL